MLTWANRFRPGYVILAALIARGTLDLYMPTAVAASLKLQLMGGAYRRVA
jgi:hypothetical protein